MELYIYDGARKLSGIVEAFDYLRWSRRYHSCGSFEIKAVATPGNLALIKTGNILWKNDDEEAGYIELVELTMEEGGEHITATGRFVSSIMGRRIIWSTENLSGELSAMLGRLLTNHLISPADTARKIERVQYVGGPAGFPVNNQISHKNLLAAISGLCEAADVGLKTSFNPATGIFKIALYQGSDVQGVFSREFENVLAQTFTESVAGYANVALVGGEGEGAERTFVTVGTSTGEGRFEIFVDAKDLRGDDFPGNYSDALIFRGSAKLAEQAMVKACDATLNQYGNLRYKHDFDIGSRVRVAAKGWGLSMTARITEIEESFQQDGMSLDVTLGRPLLTLAQKQEGTG